MLITLSNSNKNPVYEQIAEGIKRQVIAGELKCGDDLPPVRTLAKLLNVNMHTVRHAYRILAERKIITMGIGRRTRVASKPGFTSEIAGALLKQWEKLRQEAAFYGLDKSGLMELINRGG